MNAHCHFPGVMHLIHFPARMTEEQEGQVIWLQALVNGSVWLELALAWLPQTTTPRPYTNIIIFLNLWNNLLAVMAIIPW